MTRRITMLSLAALLILSLNPLAAAECDHGATCSVDRSCEKIDNGLRCTIKATGDTTVDHVRSCVKTMAGKHHTMEGVTTSFEEIEGGIVVTSTTDDPELIAKLHTMSEGCCAKEHGCCAKNAENAKHADCPHHAAAAADESAAKPGCSKPCDAPCTKGADKS